MCGRYSLGKKPRAWPDEAEAFLPRFNIAPTQNAPVCLRDGSMKMMRWGLVPRWSRDETAGSKLINARAETLAEKPSFRDCLSGGRCIVPADSFFEWRREGNRKRPMRFVLRDEQPFFFAGLCDSWKRPDGTTLESFTIITTEANSLVRSVHDRMPVMLTEIRAREWLKGPERALEGPSPLLAPFAAEEMDSYPVSS